MKLWTDDCLPQVHITDTAEAQSFPPHSRGISKDMFSYCNVPPHYVEVIRSLRPCDENNDEPKVA